MVPKNVPLLNILKNHGKSKYDFFPNPPAITIEQCEKNPSMKFHLILVGLECDFSYWIIKKKSQQIAQPLLPELINQPGFSTAKNSRGP